MKFTLSWLKTHLETDASLQQITDTLTSIGLELEAVHDRGAQLAAFRTARIVEATQHPNADRLRTCVVDTGEGHIPVVCGAPNARTGLHVVLAVPGTYIPGSDITIKAGEIRGMPSHGMLCSARELGLDADEADHGILELPDTAPVGLSYAEYAGLNDPVIEIGVTPNRGDAFAVRGIARDLAAAGLGTLKPFAPAPVESHFPSPIRWDVSWPQACPFIVGRAVRGVRNGPSPAWLRERLQAIGLRPVNTLVDITNFFAFDLGRPLHVFDVSRLQGDVLQVRRGAGETFRALNGRDLTVTTDDLVIADQAGVQSLAGVIGGQASGSEDDTTTVFIECALFDPIQIALSGRRHTIVTDARQRFERGIDQALLPAALEAATRMIIELCGGEASEIAIAGAEPHWQRDATLRFERLATLGGLDIPADQAVASLERLGFVVKQRDAAQVSVAVPSWRNDVAPVGTLDLSPALSADVAQRLAESARAMEPECDLVEEVLRLRGLDSVPALSLSRPDAIPAATLNPRQQRTALTRRVLAAQGLLECVTFSFMAASQAALFGETPETLHLSNPIASDLDQMRPTAVATLALAAQRNAARGLPDVALFEVGPAFHADGQTLMAAGLRQGHTPRSATQPSRPVDALDAKADVLAVLNALRVPLDALNVTTDAPGFYHPGRSGLLRQGPKTVLASFGELHPRLAAQLGITGPAVAFEIFLDAIPEPKRRRKAAPELSPFQPVRRDFAFLVNADVAAGAVLRAAKGAERTLIEDVCLFDVYTGDKLPEGQKSVGIEVVFQPKDRTLTDADLDAASAKIAAAVAKTTGGTLRQG